MGLREPMDLHSNMLQCQDIILLLHKVPCHSWSCKAHAVMVIHPKLLFLKIVPDIFSQRPNIMIYIDKIEVIRPGDDDLVNYRCTCLDESEIEKSVTIRYMSQPNTSELLCFLLESYQERQAFLEAFTSIWRDRQSDCFERQNLPQWWIQEVSGVEDVT